MCGLAGGLVILLRVGSCIAVSITGGNRMGHWLYHWLFLDFYVPVWPNIAADLIAAVWTISRLKTHLHRHHEAVKKTLGGS